MVKILEKRLLEIEKHPGDSGIGGGDWE